MWCVTCLTVAHKFNITGNYSNDMLLLSVECSTAVSARVQDGVECHMVVCK